MKKISILLLIFVALAAYSENFDNPTPSAPDGKIAGYGYVDLGLPSGTLWAIGN